MDRKSKKAPELQTDESELLGYVRQMIAQQKRGWAQLFEAIAWVRAAMMLHLAQHIMDSEGKTWEEAVEEVYRRCDAWNEAAKKHRALREEKEGKKGENSQGDNPGSDAIAHASVSDGRGGRHE